MARKMLVMVLLSTFLIFSITACSNRNTVKILRTGMTEMDIYEILSEYPCDGKIDVKTRQSGQKSLTFETSNEDASKLFGMDSLKRIPEIEYVRLDLDSEKDIKQMMIKTELPAYIKNVSCTSKDARKYLDKYAEDMGAKKENMYDEGWEKKKDLDTWVHSGEYHVDYVDVLISLGKPIGEGVYLEIPCPDTGTTLYP